jgi:hypothetical protein
MISAKTIAALEAPDNRTPYILGVRMRKVKPGRGPSAFASGKLPPSSPESSDPQKPAPLKVKQVDIDGTRYIVCVNARQQRKDAADRQAIVEALALQIKKGLKAWWVIKAFESI